MFIKLPVYQFASIPSLSLSLTSLGSAQPITLSNNRTNAGKAHFEPKVRAISTLVHYLHHNHKVQ